MDTTKEYIKMCEKATEIQELANREVYDSTDFFYGKLSQENTSVWVVGQAEDCGRCLKPYREALPDAVWLPRQDQLQEMLPGWKEMRGYVPLFADMIANFAHNNGYYAFSFGTFEQTLLALVMLMAYHKRWYKGNWVSV